MASHTLSFTWDGPEKRYVCACGTNIYLVNEEDHNPLRTALTCHGDHIDSVLEDVRLTAMSDLLTTYTPVDYDKPEWSRGFTYDDLYAERDCS